MKVMMLLLFCINMLVNIDIFIKYIPELKPCTSTLFS